MKTQQDFEAFRRTAYGVTIVDDISWDNAPEISRAFNEIGRSKRVLVYLSSNGGYLKMAVIIAQVIAKARQCGIDVRIVTGKYCLSAAMIILAAVPRECRYAGPNTQFLIHSAWSEDAATGKRLIELDPKTRDAIRAANAAQVQCLTADTDIKKEALQASLDAGEESWFLSDIALDLGLVSAIV